MAQDRKFNLDEYSTVAERIDAFHKEYASCRIHTEVFLQDVGGVHCVLARAFVFKDALDTYAWATGTALEQMSTGNATEKAETSAIGRALANANYAAKLDSPRASREEMENIKSDTPKAVRSIGDSEGLVQDLPEASWKGLDDRVEPIMPMDFPTAKCFHGQRVLAEGLSKGTGKPWKGLMCPQPKDASDKCEPMWLSYSRELGEWVL